MTSSSRKLPKLEDSNDAPPRACGSVARRLRCCGLNCQPCPWRTKSALRSQRRGLPQAWTGALGRLGRSNRSIAPTSAPMRA
eukprot:352249-Chlamydomonas_euryale.AAC.4